jgi:hypothetical protein
MIFPPLYDVTPYLHIEDDRRIKIAIGVGPLYCQCDGMWLMLSDSPAEIVQRIMFRVACGVHNAICGQVGKIEEIDMLARRYTLELEYSSAARQWRQSVKQITDYLAVALIMEI